MRKIVRKEDMEEKSYGMRNGGVDSTKAKSEGWMANRMIRQDTEGERAAGILQVRPTEMSCKGCEVVSLIGIPLWRPLLNCSGES